MSLVCDNCEAIDDSNFPGEECIICFDGKMEERFDFVDCTRYVASGPDAETGADHWVCCNCDIDEFSDKEDVEWEEIEESNVYENNCEVCGHDGSVDFAKGKIKNNDGLI